MDIALLPILVSAIAWWLSTGVLFWLVGRPRETHPGTAIAVSVLALVSTACVVLLRDDTSIVGAYAGFAVGLSLWAWHEAMFLLGYIAGPRRTACPTGLKTWRRFLVSAEAIIHHEVAIAIHGLLILALSWHAENQVAAWTFMLLWGMRLNAKLVVFLGAPNISETFVPDHLTYLSTYFGKRRITLFFPLFISIATAAATLICYTAMQAPAGSFEQIGLWLVATLAVLAVLEHWALVLPIPDSALWAWAQQKSKPQTNNTLTDSRRK